MNVSDALECLGAKRVIWIDDEFNRKPVDLAKMLVRHPNIAKDCNIPEIELREFIDNIETFPGVEDRIAEYLLQNKPVADRVQEDFLLKLAQQENSQKDLSNESMDRICRLLSINKDDLWSFNNVEGKHSEIFKNGSDENVLYMVDLNDATTDDKDRGLRFLVHLGTMKSRGTAFILTREAVTADEAKKEDDLRAKLKGMVEDNADLTIPTCVIAKERLLEQPDDGIVQEALQVAIKRAGLRRSIHEVLWNAEVRLRDSFLKAAEGLTRITPENLEAFVVDKGFREGVSELHVIERALTAHIARDIRHLFGTDPSFIHSAERMRSLRAIELKQPVVLHEENLEKFRRAEIWEEPELTNASLSPITCGDVFEVHLREEFNADATVRFLLIGQACDIALRWDGKRDQDTAIFVPLKVRSAEGSAEGTDKKPPLPFELNGKPYMCDFRGATSVRLSILDLASFRKDGLVRVDEGHGADRNLLAGQVAVYADRTKFAGQLLKPATGKGKAAVVSEPKLQLTFDTDKAYRHIYKGVPVEAIAAGKDGDPPALPKGISWKLRRCGRVRAPYAAFILENYTTVMSRRAFDMDFMNVSSGKTTNIKFVDSANTED